MKGLVYVLVILLVGAVGGYLAAEKFDQWRSSKTSAQSATAKSEDLTAAITEMLNRERIAYQDHDADQLLMDCTSHYTEINGNTGESMDLARGRLYYHEYFKANQAVAFDLENPQISQYPNAAVVVANYRKTSNAFDELKIQGYKGHGTWVFTRQNSIWRLASYAWSENAF